MKTRDMIRTALAVVLLLLLYLFALNGRYMQVNNAFVLDKWNRVVLFPENNGVMIQYDGR